MKVIMTVARGEVDDNAERDLLRERMKNSKYKREGFPDWLNKKSDDELDVYFTAHPTSEYNPARDPERIEQNKKRREQDEQHDKHTLPLMKRLTFKGWLKSAPTKDVRKKLRDMKEMKDDLTLDKSDLADKLDSLREAQKEDRELKADMDSPRRKKRIDKKLAKRGAKISALRERLDKIKSRIARASKRIDALHKEMRHR